jgi:hypothetical protein
MFRTLLAYRQEVLHKRHLIYCVRIMSVGCGTVAVKLQPYHSQLTNECIISYQFIILRSCSYMFRQPCAIFIQLVCTFWVSCQFGLLVDKILYMVMCILCGGLVRIDRALLAPPEDDQVMFETCRGPWLSINWMKSASRWFYYTETNTISLGTL